MKLNHKPSKEPLNHKSPYDLNITFQPYGGIVCGADLNVILMNLMSLKNEES